MLKETPREALALLQAFFAYAEKDDFAALASDHRFVGVDQRWVREAIFGYPGRGVPGLPTTPPLDSLLHPLLLVPLETSACGKVGWAIDLRIHFDGVKSVLTLECTVFRDPKGNYVMEIDEIHVP